MINITSKIKMAFNKVSMVLLVLLVVATLADAGVDHVEASSKSESEGVLPKFCSTCVCKDEPGTIKCHRYDRKIGGCPLVCGEPCACTRSIPPTCWCTYEVETCNPKPCHQNNAAKLEHLFNLDGN